LDVSGAANIGGLTRSQTLTVNGTDGLLVGSTIVPIEIPIVIDLENLTSHVVFIADGGWKIVSVQEIHSVVAENSATYTIEREPTSVTIPGVGTNCLQAASMSLTSTVNTVVTPSLSATPADYTFAAGEKMAIVKVAGDCGTVKGSITVYVKRV
jgi:hypothetical protein